MPPDAEFAQSEHSLVSVQHSAPAVAEQTATERSRMRPFRKLTALLQSNQTQAESLCHRCNSFLGGTVRLRRKCGAGWVTCGRLSIGLPKLSRNRQHADFRSAAGCRPGCHPAYKQRYGIR